MPKTLTPAATYDNSLTIPQNGDAVDMAVNMEAWLQKVVNNVKFLNDNKIGGTHGGNRTATLDGNDCEFSGTAGSHLSADVDQLTLTTQSQTLELTSGGALTLSGSTGVQLAGGEEFTRVIPMAPLGVPDTWEFTAAFGIYTYGSGANASIYFQIPQIAWCELEAVHVVIKGDYNGSGAARTQTPVTLPNIEISEVTSGGSISSLATATHGGVAGSAVAGDITAYNGANTISATGLSGIMNGSGDYHHILRVTGESGTGSLTDNRLAILNMRAVYTVTRIDK